MTLPKRTLQHQRGVGSVRRIAAVIAVLLLVPASIAGCAGTPRPSLACMARRGPLAPGDRADVGLTGGAPALLGMLDVAGPSV
jgi:hypothetical protein